MALEVLLYNLLVLGSALRCMLHKHKSSIQNRNHSINSVGGQFLETLLMSPYMGLSAFSSSVYRRASCCGAVIGDEHSQSEITAGFFKFRSVIIRNKCLVSVDVAHPTSNWVVEKNSDLSDSQLTSTSWSKFGTTVSLKSKLTPQQGINCCENWDESERKQD